MRDAAGWVPDLAQRGGSRYLAIADALGEAVATGGLKAGTRLPTQRQLAWRLGVTVGTVTRAYAEAEGRGLIAGEVGRGTFVRERTPDDLPHLALDEVDGSFVDLAHNYPPETRDPALVDAFAAVASPGDLFSLMGYRPDIGLAEHRRAGAQWITDSGVAATTETTAVTNGAQHALLLAMGALARPGDGVLTERLTFFGMKSIAAFLALRLHGVAIDQHGLRPEALDAACRVTAAKVLYCVPTLHNPTVALMPEARRREIAEICRRHEVSIVEDDIYGFLLEPQLTPLAAFAPGHAVYVTSLSKSVAPGLRIGYARAAEPVIERIAAGMRASTLMATPLMAEVATRLIRNGAAARLARARREEAKVRQAVAGRWLDRFEVMRHPAAFHVWLSLPEPWRREEFVAEARRRGVGVAPAEAFAAGRHPAPHAVRICLSAARDRGQLENALGILAGILDSQSRTAASAGPIV
jgi:DNA-binding transcriptional MocR family regulator